jgi:hypothetical protein
MMKSLLSRPLQAVPLPSRSGLVQEQSGCMSIYGNDLQRFSV